MTYNHRLEQLRDLAYDSGYYAGRLTDKSLSPKEAEEYFELLARAISKRNLVFLLLKKLYEPR